uniref:Uncharacterized protein n=1 Tax=Anopheles gambiae TaxID=7165 RepID=A0A903XYY0_ANOGA
MRAGSVGSGTCMYRHRKVVWWTTQHKTADKMQKRYGPAAGVCHCTLHCICDAVCSPIFLYPGT